MWPPCSSAPYLRTGQVSVEGKGALAEVHWSFTDQSKAEGSARLALQQSGEGWRLVNVWAFIQQIAASR